MRSIKEFFLLIMLITSVEAGVIRINVDAPYSGGVLTIIRDTVNQECLFDTIIFSNGLILNWYAQTNPILETAQFSGYKIAVNTPKSGFKFLENGAWLTFNQSSSTIWVSYNYYQSTDTIWSESSIFPDSLVHLDSLSSFNGKSDTNAGPGKQLFHTMDNEMYWRWEAAVLNFNTIVYAATKKNKIRIQFSNLYPNMIQFPQRSWIDSLHLLWSVDSLGNGKFLPGSAVKLEKRIGTKNVLNSSSLIKDRKELFRLLASSVVDIFNAQGKRIYHSGSSSQLNLPGKNIYFYRLKTCDESLLTGKIILW